MHAHMNFNKRVIMMMMKITSKMYCYSRYPHLILHIILMYLHQKEKKSHIFFKKKGVTKGESYQRKLFAAATELSIFSLQRNELSLVEVVVVVLDSEKSGEYGTLSNFSVDEISQTHCRFLMLLLNRFESYT